MKHLKNLFLISLIIDLMTLVSCGGASLKTIDEKIAKEGVEADFSSGEYDAMIGFIEKIIKEVPPYDSSDDIQMEQCEDDFGKIFTYMMVLGISKDNGKLSSSQITKLDKIQQNAAQQVNNSGFGYQEEYDFEDIEGYNDYESSDGTQKVIVDLNGNTVGNYVRETSTTYIGIGQDSFEVSKSDYNVIVLSSENGEGVVYSKDPGVVVEVYAEPSVNSPVIGNISYASGELPLTYECLGKSGQWYKIRFNHKTGYVDVKSVKWDAVNYF